MTGIYCIKNLVNGKIYIGQSINIKNRLNFHKFELKNSSHGNNYLQRSWNKYGSANFTFEIVEKCTSNELNEKEIYYISLYKDISYNLTDGGEGTKGWKPSNETKKRISLGNTGKVRSEELKVHLSKINKGKKHTEEAKKKISEAGRNCSEESRKKRSESLKGHIVTEETRQKIRDSQKGKIIPQELRKRWSESHKGQKAWNKGLTYTSKPCSEETKLKISNANKGRVISEEQKRQISEKLTGRKLSEETRLKMSLAKRKVK